MAISSKVALKKKVYLPLNIIKVKNPEARLKEKKEQETGKKKKKKESVKDVPPILSLPNRVEGKNRKRYREEKEINKE